MAKVNNTPGRYAVDLRHSVLSLLYRLEDKSSLCGFEGVYKIICHKKREQYFESYPEKLREILNQNNRFRSHSIPRKEVAEVMTSKYRMINSAEFGRKQP
jgi:hypothetical protein